MPSLPLPHSRLLLPAAVLLHHAGPKGLGAILSRVPEIMLCKPTTNDRWDRRAVELVAFQHGHGHCNVPEVGAGTIFGWGVFKRGTVMSTAATATCQRWAGG